MGSTESETPLAIDPEEETSDTQLVNCYLHRLETFLRLFGFCQYSFLSFTLSWVSFLLLGIGLPLLIIEISYCSNCEKYQIKRFELEILISESLVAAISLLCISHNLRKYGVRRFLFVDRCHGHMTQFRDDYIRKIKGFFRLLVVWVLPCFLLKAAREVFRIRYIDKDSWWQSAAIIFGSQFVALLQTTGNHGIINFINGGDFAVLSIVEPVGIIICLHAASKISHRAQALASVSSKWHALVTCNSRDNPSQVSNSNNGSGQNEAAYATGSLSITYSENDLESVDFVPVPTNTQLASSMSLYHKRQAFVTYMQSNIGGFSVFGWRIDRTLCNTIFFIELSLVLFVLGKTITF
ncbi:hypothetical protein PanWU01x14_029790 [Parasponia andersonii]|uniref:Transmembrane protein n=1 Tax=Parasponia andersonii TaxID=3476 RepID=A0A2P5DVP8_PARAD|nr:hypothetical protein PanWU01x14_029790 [Parasponia andersonii]